MNARTTRTRRPFHTLAALVAWVAVASSVACAPERAIGQPADDPVAIPAGPASAEPPDDPGDDALSVSVVGTRPGGIAAHHGSDPPAK